METIIDQPTRTDLDGSPLVIFTRYLYIQTEVKHSLLNSVLTQNKEHALFWGFELYHSGNEIELLGYLSEIYETYYSQYVNLGKFLNKKCNEFANLLESVEPLPPDSSAKECIIATIINNLIHKKYVYTGQDRKIFIITDEKDIIKYRTIVNGTINPRFILKTACLYQPFRESIHIEGFESIENTKYINIHNKYYDHWLYYASFSPIWLNRITKNGVINHTTRYIDFINDDLFETFYELFNYEPDEQSWEVQHKNIPKQENYYKFPIII